MKAATLVLLLLLPLPLLAGENRWTPIGPSGEGVYSVYRLLFPPDIPGLVYASTTESGVLRSTDGGRTWTPANAGLGGVVFSDPFQITVTPGRPRTLFAFTSHQLSKSVDAGRSWTRSDAGLPSASGIYTAVAVSPIDPATVFTVLGNRLYRSADGGGHWQILGGPSRNPNVFSVEVDARGTVYSTVYFSLGGHLYRSADRGETWSLAGNRGDIAAVIPDPRRGGILYALTDNVFHAPFHALLRSTDSGTTWTTLLDEDGQLAFDPSNPDHLYLASFKTLWSSQDGGIHWTRNDAFPGPPAGEYIEVAVDPAHPQSLLAGIFLSGIYRSDDGGRTWHPSDYPNVRVAAVTSLDRTTILAAGSRGIYRTKDGGATWDRVFDLSLTVPVTSFAVEPGTPGTIYAGTTEGLLKSADGGATWVQVLLPGGVHALAVDPSNPRRLFAGGAGLSVSNDRGRHWSLLAFHDEGVTNLVLDPRDPRTFYVTLGPVVGKTVDGGQGWRGVFATPDGQSLTGLDVAPGDPRFVYAASPTGIYRSADAGETWSLFAPPPPEFTGSLVVHPTDPGIVYASSGEGVFRNTDGQGWVSVVEGLTVPRVFRLTRDRTLPNRLFASVERAGLGAGLFEYDVVP